MAIIASFHVEIAGSWLICFVTGQLVPVDHPLVWSGQMVDVALKLVATIPRKVSGATEVSPSGAALVS